MAAITDGSRKKVAMLLENDTQIDPKRRFIQISQSWHGTVNNDEYVSPERYQEIMQQSAFSLCPKGHSVEQFRIYESIESGAIPVMELKNGYLAEHLPPAYISSPMLLIESWDDLIPTMLDLWNDPPRLRKRQQDLLTWYEGYMNNKVVEMENELILREDQSTTPFCKVRPKSNLDVDR
jgi:hypothetical protein